MPITVECFECRAVFMKAPSQVRERNFCCKECRLKWMSRNNREVINVPGHNKGCKKPHLSEYNRVNNPKREWTIETRTQSRKRALKQTESIDQGISYRKYYGRHLHRVIAEGKIGRKLTSDEVVHHIDGNKLNNNPENLMVVTKEEHARIHHKNKTHETSN